MKPARRDILKLAGAVTSVGMGFAGASKALASAGEHEGHGPKLSADVKGVLVDLSECIGCRLCEYACKKANDIDPGKLESYDDTSVFKNARRPENNAFTVINAYPKANAAQQKPPATGPSASIYTKVNCMHCNHAACASACIVGALQKQDSGAVTYDAWKCIGCRYCMVACPFQIPTYEYDNVLTPQVRKCTLCEHRTSKGELPGCVKECPRQAMTYGRREDLLALAHKKIAEHPDKYVNHVYGEHEVGGTSWLYISPVPFEEAGFQKLGTDAPPALTEAIQHGVFKHWIAPIGLYAFLSSMAWLTGRRAHLNKQQPHHPGDDGHGSARKSPVSHQRLELSIAGGGTIEVPVEDVQELPVEHVAHEAHDAHGEHHDTAEPVRRAFFTPGVILLMMMVLVGAAFGLYRFIIGLAATTNLDQQHPWGLWIAMDVGSGIALAGGGFVTAALVHIFHREHYHSIARSALLTALLGYTFYVPGLLADLGRWYNLWHPTLPMMWQGNSVLFEVGMCVMIYLNVQYLELTPIICSRLAQIPRFKKYVPLLQKTHDVLEKIMPALLVGGVTLSTFHQSSLGNLMVIAPYKLHMLWWSPLSPIMFLLSAMMVGFPMVIFTLIFGHWCLKRRPRMDVLAPLSIYAVVFMTLYIGLKIGDMIWRGTYTYLTYPNVQGIAWILEMLLIAVPLLMILTPSLRRSARGLGTACLLIILGVVLNRLNVFIVGYHPPYSTKTYYPSLTEFMVSMGLVAALMLFYRLAVTFLPILDRETEPAQ